MRQPMKPIFFGSALAALAAFFIAGPACAQSSPTQTQACTACSNIVMKASEGNLVDAYVTTGSTAGFLVVFDSATLPGNVATGFPTLRHCVQAPANSTTAIYFFPGPVDFFYNGIVVAFSSNAACSTFTASTSPLFLHARIQ